MAINDELSESNERARREALADPRTNDQLIQQCLDEDDDHPGVWDAIGILQRRGTQDVFDAVKKLCLSDEPLSRRRGADILGQLGAPERSFPDLGVDLLLKILSVEIDPSALNSIAVALGHYQSARAAGPLSALSNHPDPDVRSGVVYGLLTLDDPIAIKTMIELSSDPEIAVRDWATFGLGAQIDSDTPEIRSALMARIFDIDDETRAEAICGLANRGDERIVEPLFDNLNSINPGSLYIEAAEKITGPQFLPALRRLRTNTDHGSWNEQALKILDDAIAACESHKP